MLKYIGLFFATVNSIKLINFADDLKAEDLEKVLKNNKIVVFTKSNCTYCDQVENLLNKDNLDAFFINLDILSDKKAVENAVNTRTNNTMVPKIFINDKYIGMLSQLKELQKNGKLYKDEEKEETEF